MTGSVSFTLLLLVHGKWQEACHSHCCCCFVASDRKRVIHTAVVGSCKVTGSVSFTLLLFMGSDRKRVIHTANVGSWTMVENIPFLVHIISIWIYVYQLCSSVWSAGAGRRTEHVSPWQKLSHSTLCVNFSTSMFHTWACSWTSLTPTILNHLPWLWPCLGNHRVSAKQNLLVSFSCTRYIKCKFDMVLKQFKPNIVILLVREMPWNKGHNCCFIDCIKKLNVVWI